MIRRGIAFAIVVFTTSLFAQPTTPPGQGGTRPQATELSILGVKADSALLTLHIEGQNICAAPAVTLNTWSLPLTPGTTATPTGFDVVLPAGVPAGTYLMQVSCGNANNQNAMIDVTLGAVGPQGLKGDTGNQGLTGPKGDTGDTGANGAQGPQGIQGEVGPTGSQGSKGDTGATGLQGLQGIQGEVGPTGQQGPLGEVGPTGPQGPKGDTGATGSQGPDGPQGSAGTQGLVGIQGVAGPQGPKGDTGAVGPQGPRGDSSWTAGLVSRYSFENTLADMHGTNSPSASNGVSFVQGRNGRGVSFVTGGYIDIAASPSLANQKFSIDAWVRPDGPGPNNDEYGNLIATKQNSGCQVSQSLFWSALTQKFMFAVGNVCGSDRISSTRTFPAGVFYHVTATYDGAVLRLYVDGQLEAEKVLGQAVLYDSSVWSIGSSGPTFRGGFSRTWNGVIDEVRFYNEAIIPADPGMEGAQGPAGPQGLQGLQGPPGSQGTQGLEGVQGPIGTTGPQGPAGPAGAGGIQFAEERHSASNFLPTAGVLDVPQIIADMTITTPVFSSTGTLLINFDAFCKEPGQIRFYVYVDGIQVGGTVFQNMGVNDMQTVAFSRIARVGAGTHRVQIGVTSMGGQMRERNVSVIGF